MSNQREGAKAPSHRRILFSVCLCSFATLR
jgi:hypothetical protein